MQINPSGLASHPDPYPIYAALRQQDPVYWSPAAKLWVLTRYADVEAMLSAIPGSIAGPLGLPSSAAGRR